MRARGLHHELLAAALLVPAAAACQGLDRQVAGIDGSVQFHFAARAGVCGDGSSYFRAETGGSYTTMGGFGDGRDQCAAGPVHVVLVRYGRETVKIETYAGPLVNDSLGGRDLGAVPAREAAAYLLGLAGKLDGRPARDAILPAMLADSTTVTPALLALATDHSRSRDVRRSAISWLSRRRDEAGGVGAGATERALEKLVQDAGESESIRSAALGTIGSLDRGEGIPVLIGFAGDAESWLSHQAFQSLARSGDPRARAWVRQQVKRSDLTDENRATAIQGLGDDYATEADFKMLRDLYPTLNSDRTRDAVVSAVASAGGSENTSWLLALANSPTETAQRRRRAVSLLSRSDDPGIRAALTKMVDH